MFNRYIKLLFFTFERTQKKKIDGRLLKFKCSMLNCDLCNIINVQLSVTQSEYIGISHDSNSQLGAIAMKECYSYNIRIYEQYHTSDN